MKTLTVFTPTYNRAHTLPRTYKSLCDQTSKDFEWLVVDDGSVDNTREIVEKWIENGLIPIRYIYKENGGLYTGYNIAYANIESELCVCIDSDDYMPDYAVELIISKWINRAKDIEYCGIVGLDFSVSTQQPIGGYFPRNLHSVFHSDFELKKIHTGDTKEVMRTDLMKTQIPMIGFSGEKNFNPWFLFMNICDKYPLLVINDNLCWVEYQIGRDSMSQGIWKQYINSPRSYACYRLRAMSLKRNTLRNRFRLCIHYVSSCILSNDKKWLVNSPFKLLTILATPFSFVLTLIVLIKSKQ